MLEDLIGVQGEEHTSAIFREIKLTLRRSADTTCTTQIRDDD